MRTPADLDRLQEWAQAPSGVLVVDGKIASDGGAWWLALAFNGH